MTKKEALNQVLDCFQEWGQEAEEKIIADMNAAGAVRLRQLCQALGLTISEQDARMGQEILFPFHNLVPMKLLRRSRPKVLKFKVHGKPPAE